MSGVVCSAIPINYGRYLSLTNGAKRKRNTSVHNEVFHFLSFLSCSCIYACIHLFTQHLVLFMILCIWKIISNSSLLDKFLNIFLNYFLNVSSLTFLQFYLNTIPIHFKNGIFLSTQTRLEGNAENSWAYYLA